MNFYELVFNRGQSSGEGMTNFERLFAAKLAGGEIKELEGVPPLTFTANGQPLLDYLISGNTVQSGTPTPDNPIMPEGTGERTENLFDENYPDISGTVRYKPIYVGEGNFTLSTTTPYVLSVANIFLLSGNVTSGASTAGNGAWLNHNVTAQSVDGYVTIAYRHYTGTASPVDYKTMLNTGLTPLPYEPYGIKIPISSAGQTTTVYLGEVQTTRKIRKLVLTGQEYYTESTYWKGAETSAYYTEATGIDSADKNKIVTISSHFKGVARDTASYNDIPCVASSNRFAIFRIETATASTAAEFKQWLAQQYANGTPVTVWYVLAEPTTGIVNEPLMKISDYTDTLSMEQAGAQIPTVNGSNTLDVDTTVKPSNVYIKYKS